METKRIHSAASAAAILREGGLVAFPTETVFGLGVDATNSSAVQRLFAAKGRPGNNPLIVHVSELGQWKLAAAELTQSARALLTAFAPGPLTVVVPKNPAISPLVTAGLESVGLRIPNHPAAREIIDKANRPIAAPSANRSGLPSCTTWQGVLEDLDGRIEAVFCEDSTSIGIESTVVDCQGEIPVVLRPGAITLEQIRDVAGEARELAPRDASSAGEATSVNSPGLLHPHYQPRAAVHLIERPCLESLATEMASAYCGMERLPGIEDFPLTAVFETIEAYAAGFYEFLREVDRRGIPTVMIQLAPDSGLGKALRDRQRRSAAPRESSG